MADDYLTKPFSVWELAARIRAILRRSSGARPTAVVAVGGLEVDRDRHEVRVDGRTVLLSTREFELVAYLALHSPAVVARHELISQVWDAHWHGSTKTLDVHVSQVRRKLEDDPSTPRFLHTARGVGYRLVDAGGQAALKS